MQASAATDDYADSFISTLCDGSSLAYVVNPTADAFRELIDTLEILDPDVRVLGDESVLNQACNDFMIASLAAEFVDQGHLSIRAAPCGDTTQIITPASVVPLIELDGTVSSIRTDGSTLADDFDDMADRWEAAEPFSTETPPLSHIERSIADDSVVYQTFMTLLDATDNVCSRGEGVGVVTLALLTAARHDLLLSQVACWAEHIGLANGSTVSRTKSDLTEAGLITTEKETTQTGRPNQRLHLADEFADHSTPRLVAAAQSCLAD